MSQSPTYYGDWVASLPMYDWPEVRQETDAAWSRIRDTLRAEGVDAPERLTRRNGDMPPVPGGIRDASGTVIAPDPATLPSEELDPHVLWWHPKLLLAQACWGPMETTGLGAHVRIVGQPDYSGFEGGQGESYSSALVMRREAQSLRRERPSSEEISSLDATLPLDLLRRKRLAYNSADSMSGLIALSRDLEAIGESLDIFSDRIETGGHRASVREVAEGRADVAAIDCRSWDLIRRFEPRATQVRVVGWTARRKGLPYITALSTPPNVVEAVARALEGVGLTCRSPTAASSRRSDRTAARR